MFENNLIMIDTDLIWLYNEMGKSHEYTELQIFKEYLLTEQDKLRKQLKDETEKAEKGKVSSYVINIFRKIFEDRIKHLDTIRKDVTYQINEMDKNEIENKS